MRPVNGGTSSAEMSSGFSRSPTKTTSRAGSRQTRLIQRIDIMQASLELDLRRLGDGFFICHGEVGPLFQVEDEFGGQVGRKIPHHLVVFRYAIDVALASYSDPVFGAFQLTLEIAKILI